jgi:hypothetical protein
VQAERLRRLKLSEQQLNRVAPLAPKSRLQAGNYNQEDITMLKRSKIYLAVMGVLMARQQEGYDYIEESATDHGSGSGINKDDINPGM